MNDMPQVFEAETAHIHIAGSAPRITPPPGILALPAPRRAARGRGDDVLLVSVGLHAAEALFPGLLDHLARAAADAYFGTPGSVTAALREAAVEVNDHLVGLKKDETTPAQLEGRMVVCVLRGNDLYMAQCGKGQLIIVRSGQLSRMSSEEAAGRPLGMTHTPHVRYHHLQVQSDDLLILSTWPPPIWSDPTLSGLAGLDPAQAVDRLSAAGLHDLTGLVVRLRPVPEAKSKPLRPAATGRPPERAQRAARAARGVSRKERVARVVESGPAAARPFLASVVQKLRRFFSYLGSNLAKLLARLLPSTVHEPRPGALSHTLLIATAIAVPLVVVTLASVVYLRRGTSGHFQEYLAQAEAIVQSAEVNQNPISARSEWIEALELLDLAEAYAETNATQALRRQAQSALDALDQVVRLDFQPAITGGFGSSAQIGAVAATTSDLYALDVTRMKLWHAWATGRGYEIDDEFKCLDGADSVPGMDTMLDIAAQPAPGALGAAGVVALDTDGTLLYCAPGKDWAASQLTEPDFGWGKIQAMDVFQDNLYILDTETNAVWIYDASGGLFTGSPALYFASEFIPDLGDAIDLVMAQDALLILHADGRLDICRRTVEAALAGGTRIYIDCEPEPRFVDTRPGRSDSEQLPASVPLLMVYSPPPAPSVFFLDAENGSVYHYSMRLEYQTQYLSQEPLPTLPITLALGPLDNIFLGAGDQVYYASPLR
ncbi:MAG: PP2C family serine/threonine-protein phosphatase [Anaerolineales bacterium]|jgi:hypothetical protein